MIRNEDIRATAGVANISWEIKIRESSQRLLGYVE